ncbi:MAG: CHRD domain-containing protein [Gemmatimonadaceae bacterium]
MRSIKLSLLFALALAACNSDAPVSPPGPETGSGAAQVLIALPSTAPLASQGESRSAIAVVVDSSGKYVTEPSIVWTSSAPAVATVTGTSAIGTISAVENGTTTITAKSAGAQQSFTITVHRVMTSVSVESEVSVVGPGNITQLTTSARDALGHSIGGITNFTYTTANPAKAIVSPTGLVTALIATPVLRIVASATQDGFTISGFTNIGIFAPATFDYASQMLGESVRPTEVTSNGEGLTYIRLNGDRINSLITWIGLSGPATRLQLRGPANGNETGGVLVDLVLAGQTQPWGVFNGAFTAADILPQGGQPPISLDALVTLMRTGKVYVNVITAQNPNGELRGQIEGPFR